MGTRGVFGFFFHGKYYVFYNNWDSYFSCLGQAIVNELSEEGILALFIRLLEHVVVVESGSITADEKTDGSEGEGGSRCIIRDAAEEDVLRCKACCEGEGSDFHHSLSTALCRGFDGKLSLCYPMDSPPQFDNVFVEYGYIVDLDNMKLLVYSDEGGTRFFNLSLSEQTIPNDWEQLLDSGHAPCCDLPHPASFLQTAIAAMAERGYTFQQWVSKRSLQNVIGEFKKSESEPSVAIKCFFGDFILPEWKAPFFFGGSSDSSLAERCCAREQAVARLLLESQASNADHPASIVPVVGIIERGSSVHDVAGVVLYRAPSSLDDYFDEISRILLDDSRCFDKASEMQKGLEVLTRLKTWILDLLSALKWFHSRDLILIDLKVGNILVHENGHLMVCDFESVCKQSPQCAAKLKSAGRVEPVGSSGGDVDEGQAAQNDDKWAPGWAPMKKSRLAPGFDPHGGEATLQQDYYCFGKVVKRLVDGAILEVLQRFKCANEVQNTVLTDDDDSLYRLFLDLNSHATEVVEVLGAPSSDFLSFAEVESLVTAQFIDVIEGALAPGV